MAQIFVSHSKENKDLDFFHRGFSIEGVKSFFMEYEDEKRRHGYLLKIM